VATEHTMILDLNDVVLILLVLFLQVLQDVQFDTSLMLISFLVLNDFNCHNFACLMILALESLAKATFSNKVEHLESIVKMILEHHFVVTILIIVARIVQLI
jgi:hypothetical protein